MEPQTHRYSEESGDHTPAAGTHCELRAVKTGQYTEKVAEGDGRPHTVALFSPFSFTHVVFWSICSDWFVCRRQLVQIRIEMIYDEAQMKRIASKQDVKVNGSRAATAAALLLLKHTPLLRVCVLHGEHVWGAAKLQRI